MCAQEVFVRVPLYQRQLTSANAEGARSEKFDDFSHYHGQKEALIGLVSQSKSWVRINPHSANDPHRDAHFLDHGQLRSASAGGASREILRTIVILKANKTPSSASLVNEDRESESRLAKQKSSAQKSHTCARLPSKGNKYSRAPKARAEKTLDICSAQNSQNRSSYVNQCQEAE